MVLKPVKAVCITLKPINFAERPSFAKRIDTSLINLDEIIPKGLEKGTSSCETAKAKTRRKLKVSN